MLRKSDAAKLRVTTDNNKKGGITYGTYRIGENGT